jgi:hypothetical protein
MMNLMTLPHFKPDYFGLKCQGMMLSSMSGKFCHGQRASQMLHEWHRQPASDIASQRASKMLREWRSQPASQRHRQPASQQDVTWMAPPASDIGSQ